MRFFTSLLFLVVLCLSASCENAIRDTAKRDFYFDLQSVVDEQIALLSKANPQISKIAKIGDEEEISELTPDQSGWEKEFEIFKAANINKPSLSDVYEVTTENDASSNLQILIHKPKEGMDPEVKELKVFYLNDIENLHKIEVVYKKNNQLFESERTLSIEFEEIANQFMIKRYSIDGGQDMILTEAKEFSVQVEVNY
ncbi:MAG: hypothetical protein AAFX87_30975 [Bacteroidota bacterium]